MTSTVEETQGLTATEELDVLLPSHEEFLVTIGTPELGQLTYAVRPLSFFGKMEFFALMSGAINDLISGEKGIQIEDLLGEARMDDLGDLTKFTGAFLQVIENSPDILEDVYCLAMGVPRGRRELVKEIMSRQEEEGGLSDDVGVKIMETFIGQNGEVLIRFFEDRITPLVRKVQNQFGSQPSEPSNRTARRTRKASKSS
jgi:hypothetical protein